MHANVSIPKPLNKKWIRKGHANGPGACLGYVGCRGGKDDPWCIAGKGNWIASAHTHTHIDMDPQTCKQAEAATPKAIDFWFYE